MDNFVKSNKGDIMVPNSLMIMNGWLISIIIHHQTVSIFMDQNRMVLHVFQCTLNMTKFQLLRRNLLLEEQIPIVFFTSRVRLMLRPSGYG